MSGQTATNSLCQEGVTSQGAGGGGGVSHVGICLTFWHLRTVEPPTPTPNFDNLRELDEGSLPYTTTTTSTTTAVGGSCPRWALQMYLNLKTPQIYSNLQLALLLCRSRLPRFHHGQLQWSVIISELCAQFCQLSEFRFIWGSQGLGGSVARKPSRISGCHWALLRPGAHLTTFAAAAAADWCPGDTWMGIRTAT